VLIGGEMDTESWELCFGRRRTLGNGGGIATTHSVRCAIVRRKTPPAEANAVYGAATCSDVTHTTRLVCQATSVTPTVNTRPDLYPAVSEM
jgi:hypothetical protein